MTVVLYDLVGRDGRRFSPHCWRTRMALAHKGLECETRPTRFSEIGKIGDGQVRTVPAIEDGERLIDDSWAIAQYLEATYPERPSLFGGAGGEEVTRFVQNWCTAVLHAGLVGMIVLDIWERLARTRSTSGPAASSASGARWKKCRPGARRAWKGSARACSHCA